MWREGAAETGRRASRTGQLRKLTERVMCIVRWRPRSTFSREHRQCELLGVSRCARGGRRDRDDVG